MRYIIDMAIFGALPDYTRAVLVARELDNTRNMAASRNMLEKAVQTARSTFAHQTGPGHPNIIPWQRAYEAFRLADVLRDEDERAIPASLPFTAVMTPLTSLLNAFALQHVLPVGGDDLDRLTGNVWLRPARGNELFVPIGQPGPSEVPAISEIIYVDDGPTVLRRHWHGQPGGLAHITSETRNALLYLDCLPPIDRAQAEELAGRLAKLVSGFLGAQVEIYFLTRQQPAVQIPRS